MPRRHDVVLDTRRSVVALALVVFASSSVATPRRDISPRLLVDAAGTGSDGCRHVVEVDEGDEVVVVLNAADAVSMADTAVAVDTRPRSRIRERHRGSDVHMLA